MATSPFQYQVYDTNGATARQNVLNQMKASNEAQNNLAAQSGGKQYGGESVTVPHFNTGRDVGPVNANTNISRLASAQLQANSNLKATSNTGEVIGGFRKLKSKINYLLDNCINILFS
jgi:hypothetical protein